ncbi:MAG TPA: cytochrome c [Bryobacteraceae bacterium]|nr:cytochrome c [Bryobacteraceae bacterium]
MRPTLLFFMVAGLANCVRAQTPSETNGKVVFDKWCAPCHGAVAPKNVMFGTGALAGTSALAVKYKGKLPAVLEQRTDLTPEMIRSVVRHGLFGMPITRKTEVSDGELEDVVAYLTRNRKK